MSPYLLRPVRSLDEAAPLHRWTVEWRGARGWDFVTVIARSKAEALDKAGDDGCWPNYVRDAIATKGERVERGTGREAA